MPTLDHDAMMLQKYGQEVSPAGRLERRIVASLCAYLETHGFPVTGVHDGDDLVAATDAKSAMELIFDLDEARLLVRGDHVVVLILGNGFDIVSDWYYTEGDADGFDAAMSRFDPVACLL